MKPTIDSLNLVAALATEVPTIHYHHHILYDIICSYPEDYEVNYVEIGCFAGASSCLMLQRPNTNVFAIDLGVPIPKSTVLLNVLNHNIHLNFFTYIEGNSHTKEIVDKLKEVCSHIDILFIDGGHFKEDVIQDYSLYNEMIVKDGYMVFDDYNDFIHSPEVRIAVDHLCSRIGEYYQIIGTFKNTLEAKPKELLEGNCFVMRKLI